MAFTDRTPFLGRFPTQQVVFVLRHTPVAIGLADQITRAVVNERSYIAELVGLHRDQIEVVIDPGRFIASASVTVSMLPRHRN